MARPEEQLPFACPVCGSSKYTAVHVKRPSGNWYRTEFYRCFGCSVMFTDPVALTQHKWPPDNSERVPPQLKSE